MKPIAFMLLFGVVGLIVGTFARILITNLVLVPFIVPLVHPSAQTFGEAPIIGIVGTVTQIGFIIFGGNWGYKRGKEGKEVGEHPRAERSFAQLAEADRVALEGQATQAAEVERPLPHSAKASSQSCCRIQERV